MGIWVWVLGLFFRGIWQVTVTWCSVGMLSSTWEEGDWIITTWDAHNLIILPLLLDTARFLISRCFSYYKAATTNVLGWTEDHIAQNIWYMFIVKTAIGNFIGAHYICFSFEELHSAFGHLYLEKVPTSSAGCSLSMSGAGFCCLKISRTLSHRWSYSSSAPTIAMNIEPTMIATPTWWSRSCWDINGNKGCVWNSSLAMLTVLLFKNISEDS